MTPALHEALALIEIDGLPRAIRAQDAALKRAEVTILACAPVSPGKVVLILTGAIAPVEEALLAADHVAGAMRIDILLLPGVRPEIILALTGTRLAEMGEAVAVCEITTAAATLLSADAALKTANVELGRLHLASGYAGRGFFTLLGRQSDVEAAVLEVRRIAGERLRDVEVIAAPHDELARGAFHRPWPLDPAAE